MKLRDYQNDAVESLVRDSRNHPGVNLLVTLPTGTGKSVVIAEICKRAADKGRRVLVLQRSKELIVQNNQRYTQVDPNGLRRCGCYSAGLGMRQLGEQVTFAGVQSIAKRAKDFGHIDLVFADEAHQIPKNEDSQYQQIIRDVREINPNARFMGCTATPYRLDGGVIHGGSGALFDRMSYVAPLSKMFDDGYLTKPVTLPVEKVDMTGVRKTSGDFNKSEMQSKFLGRSITQEIYETANAKGCKSVVVFASGVAHAELIHHELLALGERSAVVTGETLPLMRAAHLDNFANHNVRWLVNVDCLTTGWDAPNVDCIVVARATESPGLFMQIVGRGTRLYPGKEQCYVIDYGGNIERHGPVDSGQYGIDTIKDPSVTNGEAPKKVCPKCFEVVHASAKTCPSCGLKFPEREKNLVSSKASITVKATRHVVVHEDMKMWRGKETGELDKDGRKLRKPDTLLVQYKLKVDDEELIGQRKRWAREWVCIEHKGYAREKAENWWNKRSSLPCPESIQEVLAYFDAGALAKTLEIELRPDGKFDRITKHTVGEKPSSFDEESLPF